MHWKITSLWGGKKVELRETPRAVTPFGGLVVFFEFLRQVGYREAVRQHLPFRLTSPNAIDPVETFTAFLLSVMAGARRFAHTSLLRADVALHELLGITRFPVDDTIRNLFKRFGQGQCQHFFSGLWNWQLERLPEAHNLNGLAFDEAHHRLFSATRNPAKFLVFDTDTGKIVTTLPCTAYNDHMIFDAARKRIYITGTETATVIEQRDADHYEHLAEVPTGYRSKTSILVPELNRLYVALSGKDMSGKPLLKPGVQLAIKIYQVQP